MKKLKRDSHTIHFYIKCQDANRSLASTAAVSQFKALQMDCTDKYGSNILQEKKYLR